MAQNRIKFRKKNAPFYKLGLISSDTKLTVEEVTEIGVDFIAFDINNLELEALKTLNRKH